MFQPDISYISESKIWGTVLAQNEDSSCYIGRVGGHGRPKWCLAVSQDYLIPPGATRRLL